MSAETLYSPRMPAARNYGLNAGRTAGGSAGADAHRPGPVESVVDLYDTQPSHMLTDQDGA